MKMVSSKKSSKLGSKVMEGSRFAILSENMDEEVNLESVQGKASKLGLKPQRLFIEVLQNLHKKMVEIGVAESQQPSDPVSRKALMLIMGNSRLMCLLLPALKMLSPNSTRQ
ncbi:hypothetical protein Ddye_013443 [Dipteronia dyeriana]|uniref:Uncharacterized protein n=1 Tax=Dipteronia dyeriana TaxID=168575 RepID=A0AAD9X6G4_9ROSI|nr:hypothetical protein Ddye_013443 [Dipteronia dyeriana]